MPRLAGRSVLIALLCFLLAACQHIAREIRSGYTIGYTPPDRDGAFHRIRVEVAHDGKRKLSAKTRPGYFASRQSGEPR